MSKALVLCGGGSLGSYEVGVWKYLEEKNIHFDIVTGTSIGALIGAMYVSGDYEKCFDLWNNLSMEDVMNNGINIGKKGLENFSTSKALAFVGSYLKNGGADNSPFVKLLNEYCSPKKIKESKIKLGIVTTKYPSMKQINKTTDDLKEEEIISYLQASSACWPIFPISKIGRQKYVDGGFSDNLPIDLAIQMGATQIVAVKLKSYPAVPQHVELTQLPFVKTISSVVDLGWIMDFKHETLMNNFQVGYLDAKKAFGDVLGSYFAFSSLEGYQDIADDFVRECVVDDPLLWKKIDKSLVKAGYNCKTSQDVFIATLEIVGKILRISPYVEYDVATFVKECRKSCMKIIKNDEDMLKFAKIKIDKALAINEYPAFIGYLYNSYKHGHKAKNAKYFFNLSPLTILIDKAMEKLIGKMKNFN